MSTRLTNLTPALATLPYPYRGALAPGRGAIVSDSPATVLANLGGLYVVEGVFRLDLTSEPGQAAFDPAVGTPSVVYADEAARDAVTPAEGDIAIVDNVQQHFSDGAWRNSDGTTT